VRRNNMNITVDGVEYAPISEIPNRIKLKVGDWVRHPKNGIGRVVNQFEDCTKIISFNLFEEYENSFEDKLLTRVYPKFDKFEDLFVKIND